MGSVVKSIVNIPAKAIETVGDVTKKAVGTVLDPVLGTADKAVKATGSVVKDAAKAASKGVETVGEAVKEGVGVVANPVADAAVEVKKAADDVTKTVIQEGIAKPVTAVGEGVKDTLEPVMNVASDIAMHNIGIAEGVAQGVGDALQWTDKNILFGETTTPGITDPELAPEIKERMNRSSQDMDKQKQWTDALGPAQVDTSGIGEGFLPGEIQALQDSDARRQARIKKAIERRTIAEEEEGTFAEGKRRAMDILGPEGLGRLREDADIAEAMAMRRQPIALSDEIIAQQRKAAEEGMGREAMAMQRGKLASQMQEALQKAGMRVGSSLGGMQGQAAAAQQRSLTERGLTGLAGIERDMFLANQAAKERGRAGLMDAAGLQQRAIEGFAVPTERIAEFDLARRAQERALESQMGMHSEMLESEEYAAALGADAAKSAARQPTKSKGLLGGLWDWVS